jgi:hypothetical protein
VYRGEYRGVRAAESQPSSRQETRGDKSADKTTDKSTVYRGEHHGEYRGVRAAESQPSSRQETRGGGSFTQLFVSIGRNRRVFSRDLIALFSEKLSLAPGDIGDVRVFEKYSFVDIAPARAGEAIEKLSGMQLKGRTIAVNYAKKKEEKEET